MLMHMHMYMHMHMHMHRRCIIKVPRYRHCNCITTVSVVLLSPL